MFTWPAVPGGETAVISEAETTLNAAAAVPKLTAATPAKLLPDMVTLSPPAVLPKSGQTPLTAGVPATGAVVEVGHVGTVVVVVVLLGRRPCTVTVTRAECAT